jgi:hypothetical protein
MVNARDPAEPLNLLVGREASAVCFVRDYVELHLNGPMLRAVAGPCGRCGSGEWGEPSLIDDPESRVIVDGACVRAPSIEARPAPRSIHCPTGPSYHSLWPFSAANTHDIQALEPLVMAILAINSRRGPRRRTPANLHADKAYDQPGLRRWVIERTMA